MNSGIYDYEALTQNCNTSVGLMADSMGLRSEVRAFLDEVDVWAPGFEKDFNHSAVDKAWDITSELGNKINVGFKVIDLWIEDFKNSREFENINLVDKFNNNYSLVSSEDFKNYLKQSLEQELQQPLTDEAFEDLLKQGNQYYELSKNSESIKSILEEYNSEIKNISITPNGVTGTYQIQPGQTLSEISLKSGVSIDKLLELNPQITDPNLIKAGDTLILREAQKETNITINKDSYNISTKDQEETLKNSELLAKNPQYTDKDGNAISQQEAIFTVKDKDGNINTIQKEGVMATLKDGTKALLSSVVEMTENVAEVTKEFVDGYMNQANKLFTTGDGIASLISDVNAGLQKGEEPEQIARTIATKLAIKQIFEQGSEVIKQQIQENLMDNAADIAALESGNYLELSVDAIESLQKIRIYNFSSSIYNGI